MPHLTSFKFKRLSDRTYESNVSEPARALRPNNLFLLDAFTRHLNGFPAAPMNRLRRQALLFSFFPSLDFWMSLSRAKTGTYSSRSTSRMKEFPRFPGRSAFNGERDTPKKALGMGETENHDSDRNISSSQNSSFAKSLQENNFNNQF